MASVHWSEGDEQFIDKRYDTFATKDFIVSDREWCIAIVREVFELASEYECANGEAEAEIIRRIQKGREA